MRPKTLFISFHFICITHDKVELRAINFHELGRNTNIPDTWRAIFRAWRFANVAACRAVSNTIFREMFLFHSKYWDIVSMLCPCARHFTLIYTRGHSDGIFLGNHKEPTNWYTKTLSILKKFCVYLSISIFKKMNNIYIQTVWFSCICVRVVTPKGLWNLTIKSFYWCDSLLELRSSKH